MLIRPTRSWRWMMRFSRAAVIAHVQQVEQILGGEQAQWGQLVGEIKPVTPPETTPEQDKPPSG
jgi:hypothetical protein